MPLFIANQTATGGEVQMRVSDWHYVASLLLTRPRSRELPRRIMGAIDGLAPDVVTRIRLTSDEIERVDAVLQGQ